MDCLWIRRIVKIKFDICRLHIVSPRIFGLTLRVLKLNELFTRRDDLLYNPTRQQQPLVTHNKRDRAVVKKSGTITWIDKQYDNKDDIYSCEDDDDDPRGAVLYRVLSASVS